MNIQFIPDGVVDNRVLLPSNSHSSALLFFVYFLKNVKLFFSLYALKTFIQLFLLLPI